LVGAGEPGVEHCQRARHQERRTEALQAAGADQNRSVGRGRAQQRSDGEHQQPGPQDGQPAEHVGDRAGEQDDRTEGQQVPVDHPLLQSQPAAELGADGG